MLVVRSQIFEYLRETLGGHALGYLLSARSEKKKTGKNAGFLRKRLVIVDLFERLVVGGMFSPLVPVVRP